MDLLYNRFPPDRLYNTGMTGKPFYRRTWFLRSAALLILVSVFILRDPRYFLTPRLWAEEGTLHLSFAYTHSGLMSLLQPQQGYLNFWPNLATFTAARLPLATAPLVTTLFALLVQILPVILILWSQSPLWETWKYKLWGIAIYLFVPLSSEGWLNTINSYTFFAVIAFLIILEPATCTPVRRWWYRSLLFLSGLSGALSAFLLPLFAGAAFFEKPGKNNEQRTLVPFWKQERWVQTFFMTLAALVQALIILSVRTGANLTARFQIIGAATLGVTIWTQSIALFSLGLTQAHTWARSMFTLAAGNLSGFQSAGRFLLFAGIALLWLLSARLPVRLRYLFLSGYAVLLIPTMMFSIIQDKYSLIDTGLHQRLFLPPNILLGWMLLLNSRFSLPFFPIGRAGMVRLAGNFSALASALLLTAALFWGAWTFFNPANRTSYWPDWKTQVAAWQADPSYVLKIQPQGWELRLKPP